MQIDYVGSSRPVLHMCRIVDGVAERELEHFVTPAPDRIR